MHACLFMLACVKDVCFPDLILDSSSVTHSFLLFVLPEIARVSYILM